MVQDSFTLSLRRPCSDSTLVQTNNLNTYTYYINSGNFSPIVPTYTDTPAAGDPSAVCTPFFYLHVWDDTQMIWVEFNPLPNPNYSFVGSWTAATGTLIVNTADFATYDMSTFSLRITTMNSNSVFED